ncbi:LacI family DNA-binding transcriptional regulator [Microbacteriaceae bacterium VKM Ac-2855]|nr:LacI family DNA-binding transcriptional regulator [Microbacteriaceae bacterium VKM Ac-2855]
MVTSGSPTIYDVAARAGVSKSLVSLVLTGSPRVSEKRRAAVLQAIDELDYRPSRAAAHLAGNRTRSIGVVIDDYRNLWFVELLRGMQEQLDAAGYQLSVADRHLGPHPVDAFLSMRVDGLVIAAEPDESMRSLPVPTVVAGSRDGTVAGADRVANDDAHGAGLAAAHLIGLGHTAVGHLTGAGGAAALRRRGFEQRMREAGLTVPVYGDGSATTEEDGYAAARALLAAHPQTTALFAANDTMALGAFAAIAERGLSVPRDVSVIGYDDSPLAHSRYLAITTIDGRNAEVGRAVAREMLARLNEPDREPTSTLIQPGLVLRSSTAPPR